ncbi:MAG TPA: YrbL family protein [Syntrophales bacterium]|nr:YrbL family protein [Syntrophales bacterium]HPX55571.1 YrbL family protein [Syntrophales bacterium]HQA81787.1 YrbL family protein [Syntrophales bacterium]
MLDLESSPMVGRGLHRACYVHPRNGNLCVKVLFPLESREPLIEAERETSYYRVLKKRGVPWTMLPEFHGEVETTRGKGYIFDLIRDEDGSVSKTLRDYLSSPRQAERYADALSAAFDLLRDYLLQWKIITMTIKAKNILYQRISETEGRLIIVDNIGNSDFIPICDHVGFLAERKIRRKWRRFEDLLLEEYPQSDFVRKKFRR